MRTFSTLTLNDCQVGLADLLEKRLPTLTSTKAGKGQVDVFVALKQDIDALPDALTGKKPLSDELAETDGRHDGLGSTIWFLTEAYLRWPESTPTLRAAALRLRAAFIPELGELNAGYADEAAKAERREADVTTFEADLKLFPLAEGKTLHDVATAYVGAGKDLSTLISKRADITAANRAKANALRSETIGALNDLRRSVAREQKRGSGLTGDIDAAIFGFLDMLEERRKETNRTEKKDAPPASGETTDGKSG